MQKEIEVKIQISDVQLKKLEHWLDSNSCFLGKVHHCEYYLNNPNASFTFIAPEGYKDSRYYLRIRHCKEKGDSLCLKKWHGDQMGKTRYCDEWEINVSDVETALQMLKELGFTEITCMQKVRRIYKADVFEIVIDEVKGLGIFIEFELKEYADDIDDALARIYDFIKQVGITTFKKQERGYVSMIWNPRYDFGEKINL